MTRRLGDHVGHGRRRIDDRERLRGRPRRPGHARFQHRHRPPDQAEGHPLRGKGAGEHQRQLPGDVEQLMIGRGIVGRAQEPVIERLEMRQRARGIGDLARYLADLLGHHQQELRAEAVCGERNRRLLLRRGRRWRRRLLRRGIGDSAQRIDHLRALGVILQCVERPLRLFRRQRIRVCGGGRRCGAALGQSRRSEKRAGEKDRSNDFLRHEDSISNHVRRPSRNRIDVAYCVMSGRPFLRDRVSEICRCNVLANAIAPPVAKMPWRPAAPPLCPNEGCCQIGQRFQKKASQCSTD